MPGNDNIVNIAAGGGSLEVVERLLKANADINALLLVTILCEQHFKQQWKEVISMLRID